MKKIYFMLLCAATLALVGCNQDSKNEPTSPTPTTEVKEADFIIKFYTCDSLLKYTNISLKDEMDTTLDCSHYTCAKPDTINVDKADWEKITFAMGLMTEPYNLTVDNIKIITLKVHLTKGHSHAFRLTYTRNGVVAQSDKLDAIIGGSAQKESELSLREYASAEVHLGIFVDKLDDFLYLIHKNRANVVGFSF